MEAVTFLLQLLITDSACVCLAVSGMGVRAEDGMCEGRVLCPPPTSQVFSWRVHVFSARTAQPTFVQLILI